MRVLSCENSIAGKRQFEQRLEKYISAILQKDTMVNGFLGSPLPARPAASRRAFRADAIGEMLPAERDMALVTADFNLLADARKRQ